MAVIYNIPYVSNFFDLPLVEKIIKECDFFTSYWCGENANNYFVSFEVENAVYTVNIMKSSDPEVNLLYINCTSNKISDIKGFYYKLVNIFGGIEYCNNPDHYFLPLNLTKN